MSAIPNEIALEERLCGGAWEFRRAEGVVIAPAIRFGPRGQISGHIHHNEIGWRLHQGCLELIGSSGAVTTRFDNMSIGADGRIELRGAFLVDPASGVAFILREAEFPTTPAIHGKEPRRNLVIMRAGNGALLPKWTPAASRNWDLAISFYGEGAPDWGQEYFHAAKGPKWQPINHWLNANPDLLKRYDYFWFPDDDIMTSWENVNNFFDICRDFDLQLAQPALTSDSFVCHAVTQQDPNCLLRFTIFVEGMVPAFRADALRLCLPVMQEESRFGWGHDWIFPMLLGYPPNKIAIVDACAVTHTRPAGANTDYDVANAQLLQILVKYGARFMDHRVRGQIFLQPTAGVFVP